MSTTTEMTVSAATGGMTKILDTAQEVQGELSKAEGMKRAIAMASGLVALQNAMSPDVVSVLMALAGNPQGFRTDKKYPAEVVKAVAIQALLHGAYLVDDEFQIIAGNLYLGQRYYVRKLREHEGVTDVRIDVTIPEKVAHNVSMLLVGGYACCRVDGKLVEVFAEASEKFGDSRIVVTAFKGDFDQAQGKARKRLAQRLYERVAGVVITEDAGDEPSRVAAEPEPVSEPANFVESEEMNDAKWAGELALVQLGQEHIRDVMNDLAMSGSGTHPETIARASKIQKAGKIDQRGMELCRRYGQWLREQA